MTTESSTNLISNSAPSTEATAGTFRTFAEAFADETAGLPLVVFDPTKQHVPVRAWLRTLDEGAQEQALGLSALSIVKGNVALMPDAHMGNGCSVGTVFATVDHIVPSTVGVDLGCGMIAMRYHQADVEKIKYNLENNPAALRRLHQRIRDTVPTGFAGHHNEQDWDGFDRFPIPEVMTPVSKEKSERMEALVDQQGRKQLGSLGGGNHFIELCLDDSEQLWLMVHSGSRGIGNRIGTHFMQRARAYCDANNFTRPRELDWLPVDHPDGQAYLSAMLWAQDYARENRHHMMRLLTNLIKNDDEFNSLFHGSGDEATFIVENHHNFVRQEQHFGETCWVHRKGAVSAQQGEWGILPGSMATGSFIVRGKGETSSLCSCAHGSGRKMSRNEAKRKLTPEDVENAMKGIIGERAANIIDEAPQAYKNLDEVMGNQTDLIESVYRLRPILNVKGY